jgi:hypothetical protein
MNNERKHFLFNISGINDKQRIQISDFLKNTMKVCAQYQEYCSSDPHPASDELISIVSEDFDDDFDDAGYIFRVTLWMWRLAWPEDFD